MRDMGGEIGAIVLDESLRPSATRERFDIWNRAVDQVLAGRVHVQSLSLSMESRVRRCGVPVRCKIRTCVESDDQGSLLDAGDDGGKDNRRDEARRPVLSQSHDAPPPSPPPVYGASTLFSICSIEQKAAVCGFG